MAVITEIQLSDTFREWVVRTQEITARLNSISENDDSVSITNLTISSGGVVSIASPVTFSNTLNAQQNVTLNSSGTQTTTINGNLSGRGATFSQGVTASSFTGDGSNLTGINTDVTSSDQISDNVIITRTVADRSITRNKLDNTIAGIFASGTRMIFHQATAPEGWTRLTAEFDGYALRVTNENGGAKFDSGRVDFESAFSTITPSGLVSVTIPTQEVSTTPVNTTVTSTHNLSTSSRTVSGTTNNTVLDASHMPNHRHYVFQSTPAGSTLNDPPVALSSTNYPSYRQNYWNFYNFQYGQDRYEIVSDGDGGQPSIGLTSNPTQSGGSGHNHTFTSTSHSHAVLGDVTSTVDSNSTRHNHTVPEQTVNGVFSGDNININVKYTNVIICQKD